MRKRLGVVAAMTATLVFAMVGTASAQVGSTCPAAGGPTYERPAATTQPISTTTPGWDVAGNVPRLGYGQADVNPATLGYSGTLNGPGIGYGDIDAQLLPGPSGAADGEVDGVATASGSLSGGTLAIQTDTAVGPCVSVTVP